MEATPRVRSTETGSGIIQLSVLIQARDGTLHGSYGYHLGKKDVPLDNEGQPARKSIKQAHFNEAWLQQGDPR